MLALVACDVNNAVDVNMTCSDCLSIDHLPTYLSDFHDSEGAITSDYPLAPADLPNGGEYFTILREGAMKIRHIPFEEEARATDRSFPGCDLCDRTCSCREGTMGTRHLLFEEGAPATGLDLDCSFPACDVFLEVQLYILATSCRYIHDTATTTATTSEQRPYPIN